MRILKHFLNFYINSSIHVALAVYALTRISLLNFNILYDEPICYFIFYGTIVSYNFIKYGSKARKYFIVASRYIKLIQLVSFIAFGLCVYYALQLEVATLVWASVLGLLSLLYILPFLPSNKSMRTLAGIKIYIVALCWAGTTVWLPLVNNQQELNANLAIELLQRFLFVLVITLPFEIRDLRFDQKELATIPQEIGVKKTKIFGVLLLVLFFLLSFLKSEVLTGEIWVNAIVMVIAMLLLVLAKTKQTAYYSSLFVESLPIVWLLILSLYS